MQKKYFGNYCLQNTVRTVKKTFPECKIRCFEDGAEKKVVVLFSPDNRKKYNISENVKTYRFLNKHLILTNGPMDPFKYDNLDALIEETELEYEINQKRTFIEKTKAALDSCLQFHDLAKVIIGNYVNGSFDIRLTLNGIERTYHIDNETTNVHMEKLDPETELTGAKEFQLSKLPPNVQYKILKTTHPGLLTAATEYISGIRDGKESWRNAADAYTAEWKRKYYMQFGIDAFDVLIDIPENILVGEYSTRQIRKLFLLDGSKFIYIKNPLQVIPYARAHTKGDTAAMHRLIFTMLRMTGAFSLAAGAGFVLLGAPLAGFIYRDAKVGRYVQLLGFVAPFMYLESMVDGVLKGLGEQLATFRYSLFDSVFRIAAIWLVVPQYGMMGFLGVMAVSNLMTCGLNMRRMMEQIKKPSP